MHAHTHTHIQQLLQYKMHTCLCLNKERKKEKQFEENGKIKEINIMKSLKVFHFLLFLSQLFLYFSFSLLLRIFKIFKSQKVYSFWLPNKISQCHEATYMCDCKMHISSHLKFVLLLYFCRRKNY